MTGLELLKNAAHILDEKKGENIKAIKVTDLTIIADYFLIVSGTSTTHIKALAGEVEDFLSKQGIEPLHIEGKATGWILIDYGTLVIHVFTPDMREYYKLERLWDDADAVELDI